MRVGRVDYRWLNVDLSMILYSFFSVMFDDRVYPMKLESMAIVLISVVYHYVARVPLVFLFHRRLY